MSTKADLIHDLFEAINKKQLSRVEALLDEGASPDLPIGYLKGKDQEPFNALTMTLMTQQVEMFQLMLEKGADPFVRHPKTQDTLLHIAVSIRGKKSAEITQRSYAMSKLLLDYGVLVDSTNIHGVTALEDAVISDEPVLVQLLLEHGADPMVRNVLNEDIFQMAARSRPECYRVLAEWMKNNVRSALIPIDTGEPTGLTEEEINAHKQLMKAVATADMTAIRKSLDEGVSINGFQYNLDRPLHLAVSLGLIQVVSFLLENGADPLAFSFAGMGVLHAAHNGFVNQNHNAQLYCDLVELLVKYRAPVNHQDQFGQTALMLAVMSNQVPVAQLLLNAGADPGLKSRFGQTAASLAVQQSEDMQLLFSQSSGSNDRLKQAVLSVTEQMWQAIENGDSIDVSIAIDRGASAKIRHSSGLPLIHFCWQAYTRQPDVAYFEMLDALHTEGLDINANDSSGQTVLCLAAQAGDPDWVAKLLSLGADFQKGKPRVLALEKVRQVPDGLHAQCYLLMEERYWDSLVDHDKIRRIDQDNQRELDKVEALLRNELVTDQQRQSLLDAGLVYAVMSSDSDSVKRLVEQGSNVNSAYVPLRLAVGEGNLGVVEYLLEEGADATYKDQHGCILHHVFHLRNWKIRDIYHIAIRLLKEPIDIEAKDTNGDTPLYLAVKHGKPLLVKLLLDHGAEFDRENDGLIVGNSKNEGHIEAQRMLDWFCKNNIKSQTVPALFSTSFLLANDGLMSALENGDIEALDDLYAKGVNLSDARAAYFLTPIQFAVTKGQLASVQWLLNKEVDRYCHDLFGQTLLHHALLFPDESRCLAMMRLIMTADFPIDAQDQMGYTALHKANMVGFTQVAEYLLSQGANASLVTKDGESTRSLSKQNWLDVVMYESQPPQPEPELRSNAEILTKIEGQSARLRDSLLQLSDKLKFLNKGSYMAKPTDTVMDQQDVLADEFNTEIKHRLIEMVGVMSEIMQVDAHKAEELREMISGCYDEEVTETADIQQMSDQDLMQYIYGQVCANYTSGLIEGLSGREFDFNQPLDNQVLSVLDMVVCLGCVDIFDTLINEGADPFYPIRGRSLLNETLRYCQYEGAALRLTSRMLDLGFDVNEIDEDGLSLVRLAGKKQWYRVIRLLVERGVSHDDLFSTMVINDAEAWYQTEQKRLGKLSEAERLHENLWDAIRSKCWIDAEKAINAGAPVNGCRDEQPLRLAIVTGNVDAFLALLVHPDLDLALTNLQGETYFHACAQYEKGLISSFMADKLIQQQAIDINAQDSQGNTALMWAVLSNNVYLIWALCHRGLANPGIPNLQQQTAMTFSEKAGAISQEHRRVMHMLEWSMARQDAKEHSRQYDQKSAQARKMLQFIEMPNDDDYDDPDFMDRSYAQNGLLALFQVKEDSEVHRVYQALLMPNEPSPEVEVKALLPENEVKSTEALLRVYDIKALEKLAKSEDKEYSKIFSTLNRHDNGFRVLQKVPENFYAGLVELKENFPNMLPFLEYVERNASLSGFRKYRSMYLPPVVLVSKPGLGKTECVKKVAELLSVPFHFVDFSTATANWIMTGSSASWKDAKSGMVFNSCVKGDVANPLFLCDEIDKSSGDARYPAINVFHTLLEKGMAKNFADEFYPELKIDASQIMYVATANALDSISEPILSRFQVIEIQEPSREQMPAIVHSVYRSILHDEGYESFPERLTNEVIENLLSYTPRQVKSVLNQAFANAAYRMMTLEETELAIQVEDLGSPATKNKRGIGFVHH